MRVAGRSACAGLLGLALATGNVHAEKTAQTGAKELYFALDDSGGGLLMSLNDSPGAAGSGFAPAGSAPEAAGLHYWIELQEKGSGEPLRVTESRIFKDGERIRIRVVGNREGYISILQVGASGVPSLLFPTPDVEAGLVEAGETTTLPSDKAWFRFDHRKGVERIFMVFAPSRQVLDSTLSSTRTLMAAAQPSSGNFQLAGAKDLLVEVEQNVESEVGTYLVSPAGEAIVFEIRLNHQ